MESIYNSMRQEEDLFKVEEEKYRCEGSRKIRSNIVEVSLYDLLDLSCEYESNNQRYMQGHVSLSCHLYISLENEVKICENYTPFFLK